MKLSIEHYIATNNPKQVNELLAKYKIPKSKDWSDMIRKLQYVMKKHKDTIVDDLKLIDTPYKSLILSGVVEKKSGACGCSSADGEESYQNCAGNPNCNCELKSNVQGTKTFHDQKSFHDQKTSGADGESSTSTNTNGVSKIEKSVNTINKYAPAILAVSAFGILIAVVAKKG